MQFGRLPTDEAVGAILAHTLGLPDGVLKKGRRLDRDDVEALRRAGHLEVVAARLEAGDVHEDETASLIAAAAAGSGVRSGEAFTGRCNLYAGARGVVVLDRARVDRLNLVDESVTIATVIPYLLVEEDDMVATVKVIPFAARAEVVRACADLAAREEPLLRVAPLRRRGAGLVLTRLRGTREGLLDRAAGSLRSRLVALGSDLKMEVRCAHEPAAVADALAALLGAGCEPVFLFGGSAVVDRRDVIPAGIERAGGVVEHFGMPVDPGNLLLLARHGETTVVGVPACARSLKPSGFDWVLQRLLADLPVTRADLMGMGAGGLLKEIATRPQPRERR